MIQQLTAQLVRSYKGAAASIILLFLVERMPLTQEYMRRYTGYPNEAISDAVKVLRDTGFLVEVGRYTWALLADGLRQLPIMAQDAEPGESPEALPFASVVDKPVDKPVDNFKIIHRPVETAADFGSSAARKPAANPHACMQDSDSPDSFDGDHACMGAGAEKPAADDLVEALRTAGFREPGLSRLARQAGLTARVVRYHVAHAPSLGAALHRIERGWRVPEDWEPEPTHRNCSRCGDYTPVKNLRRIDGLSVCFDCMDDAEYERYGPSG